MSAASSSVLIVVIVVAVLGGSLAGDIELGSYVGSPGTSYAHLTGPVVGPPTPVHDAKGNLDYVAYPKYTYAYGVQDGRTGDVHDQKEERDGHQVTGEYSLVEPDGNKRTVSYSAGEFGFIASVHNTQKQSYPAH